MGDRTTTLRVQAIEDFATALADLRESVGRPSFRVMAGRSQAISHTTLHEAVHGNRLPSWATTAEFVKACGADPRLYRDRWEVANRTVVSVTHGACRPVAGIADHVAPGGARELALATRTAEAVQAPESVQAPEPALAPESVQTPEPALPPEPALALERTKDAQDGGFRRAHLGSTPLAAAMDRTHLVPTALGSALHARWHPDRRTLLGVATLVVTVATGLGFVWSGHEKPSPGPTASRAPAAADCPVHQQNPPAAPPAHKGDRATFVADVTLGDCTHVQAGQTLPKVWRLKNTGSVPWVGYTLHRLDLPQQRGQCQTISDVPVPDTTPGQVVDVRVGVSVPTSPTFCVVRFKMVDAGGQVAFPGSRPVNFQVIVDPSNRTEAQGQG